MENKAPAPWQDATKSESFKTIRSPTSHASSPDVIPEQKNMKQMNGHAKLHLSQSIIDAQTNANGSKTTNIQERGMNSLQRDIKQNMSQRELKTYINKKINPPRLDKFQSVHRLLEKQHELQSRNSIVQEQGDSSNDQKFPGSSFVPQSVLQKLQTFTGKSKETLTEKTQESGTVSKDKKKKRSKSRKKKDRKKSKKKDKKKKKRKRSSSSSSSISDSSSVSLSSSSSDSSERRRRKKKNKKKAKSKKKKDKPKTKNSSTTPTKIDKSKKGASSKSVTPITQKESEQNMDELDPEDEKIIEEMRKEFLVQKQEARKEKVRIKFNGEVDDEIYSDDCKKEKKHFQRMAYKTREEHLIFLWHRAFVKGRAGHRVLKWALDIKQKILKFGITGKQQIQDIEIDEQIQWWIIMPSGKVKSVWNTLMIMLLVYTATFMVFKTCFIDEETTVGLAIDYTIDFLFFVDIFINFLSAEEDDEQGILVHNQRDIFWMYLKGWFLFDFLSVFQSVIPFMLTPDNIMTDSLGDFDVESMSEEEEARYQKLMRLLRIPRLYKMIRIFRIFKMLKISKNFKGFQKIKKTLRMNAAIMRLVQGVVTAVMVTHIFACVWFLSAKIIDFGDCYLNEDGSVYGLHCTWVRKLGLEDADPSEQYIYAMHWATQTITTVGYGDITANTNAEIVISLLWMLFGVAFYSFIIGNFSSLISGNDQMAANIEKKVRNLAVLSQKANIPFELTRKIKTFIGNNSEGVYSLIHETNLIKMLTPALRDELLSYIYGKIVAKVQFFKDCKDQDFLWHVLPQLKTINLKKGDVLFFRGDYAEDIYFIVQGIIKLYSTDGNPFHKVSDGQMLGESDTLLDLPRNSKAIAQSNLQMLVLSKSQFENLFQYSQEYCFKMIMESRVTRDNLANKMSKLDQKLRSRKERLAQKEEYRLQKEQDELRQKQEMEEQAKEKDFEEVKVESDCDTISMKSAISGVSAINMIRKVGNKIKTSSANIMAFSIMGNNDKDESENNITSLQSKSILGVSGQNTLSIPGQKKRIPMGKKFSTPVLPNSFITTVTKSPSVLQPSQTMHDPPQASPEQNDKLERGSSIDSKRFNVMPIAQTAQVTESVSPSPTQNMMAPTTNQLLNFHNQMSSRSPDGQTLKPMLAQHKFAPQRKHSHALKQPRESSNNLFLNLGSPLAVNNIQDDVSTFSTVAAKAKQPNVTNISSANSTPYNQKVINMQPVLNISRNIVDPSTPKNDSNTSKEITINNQLPPQPRVSFNHMAPIPNLPPAGQKVRNPAFNSRKNSTKQSMTDRQSPKNGKRMSLVPLAGGRRQSVTLVQKLMAQTYGDQNSQMLMDKYGLSEINEDKEGVQQTKGAQILREERNSPQQSNMITPRGSTMNINQDVGSEISMIHQINSASRRGSQRRGSLMMQGAINFGNTAPANTMNLRQTQNPKKLQTTVKQLSQNSIKPPTSQRQSFNKMIIQSQKSITDDGSSGVNEGGDKDLDARSENFPTNQQHQTKKHKPIKSKLSQKEPLEYENADGQSVPITTKKGLNKFVKKNDTLQVYPVHQSLKVKNPKTKLSSRSVGGQSVINEPSFYSCYNDIEQDLAKQRNRERLDTEEKRNNSVSMDLNIIEQRNGVIVDMETVEESPLDKYQRKFISNSTIEKVIEQKSFRYYLGKNIRAGRKNSFNNIIKDPVIKLKKMNTKEMDINQDMIIVKRVKNNKSRIGQIMEIRAPNQQLLNNRAQNTQYNIDQSSQSEKRNKDSTDELAAYMKDLINDSNEPQSKNKYRIQTNAMILNQMSARLQISALKAVQSKIDFNNESNLVWKGNPDLKDVNSFNKDASLIALNIFEIQTAAKNMKRQREMLEIDESHMDKAIETQGRLESQIVDLQQEVLEFVKMKKETANLKRPVQNDVGRERTVKQLEKRIFRKKIIVED